MRNRLRQPIPSFSICLVKPPPRRSMRSTRRTGWSGFTRCSATTASLPDWLDYQLKHQPMLFIGCEIPDWIGRFLLRMSSNTRLSLERNAVLLRRLLNLARTVAVEISLQRIAVRRWSSSWRWSRPSSLRSCVHAGRNKRNGEATPPRLAPPVLLRPDAPTIFISYMREDADAARRLCNAITESRRGRVAGRATATPGRCMGAGDFDRDPPNCPLVRPDHLGEHGAGGGRLRFPGVEGGGRSIALHYGSPLHRARGCRRRLRGRPESVPADSR